MIGLKTRATFQPIRSKAKTCRDSLRDVFPRFAPSYVCKWWLVHWIVGVLCDWLGRQPWFWLLHFFFFFLRSSEDWPPGSRERGSFRSWHDGYWRWVLYFRGQTVKSPNLLAHNYFNLCFESLLGGTWWRCLLVDGFLDSHHIFAWLSIDTVGRNSTYELTLVQWSSVWLLSVMAVNQSVVCHVK